MAMDSNRIPPVSKVSDGLDPVVHNPAADRRDPGSYSCRRAIHFHPAFASVSSRVDDWMQNFGKRRSTRGIYLVGQVLIFGIAMLIGGETMRDLLIAGRRVDENELQEVMSSSLSALLVALTLSIPLMMAAWFAPLLVIFRNLPPLEAMRLSFYACVKNIVAFQIYAFFLVVLTAIAAFPYGLGLFVLVPTLFASIYASYQDIFCDPPEAA
jgi:hypothetical protein